MVSVLGSGFTLDGSPVSGTLSGANGNLVGTLQNGDTLDVSLDVFQNGDLVLGVPEPATAGLLVMAGLLILGRRQHRV